MRGRIKKNGQDTVGFEPMTLKIEDRCVSTTAQIIGPMLPSNSIKMDVSVWSHSLTDD